MCVCHVTDGINGSTVLARGTWYNPPMLDSFKGFFFVLLAIQPDFAAVSFYASLAQSVQRSKYYLLLPSTVDYYRPCCDSLIPNILPSIVDCFRWLSIVNLEPGALLSSIIGCYLLRFLVPIGVLPSDFLCAIFYARLSVSSTSARTSQTTRSTLNCFFDLSLVPT